MDACRQPCSTRGAPRKDHKGAGLEEAAGEGAFVEFAVLENGWAISQPAEKIPIQGAYEIIKSA